MNIPTDLLEKIKLTPKKHKTMLIGVDGVGGAGKTTLSEYIKSNLDDVTIVQLDDFYLPELGRANRERVLQQVFIPLEKNTTANYQIYDWVNDSHEKIVSINPGGIVVVEGVYALHPDFANRYDFMVWINCPQEIGFKRGIERDKIRDGVDNSDKWLNIWMPKEKEYVESKNPQQYADYILNST